MPNPTSLQMLKDAFAKSLFGITKEEAIKKQICIHCKRPISLHPSSEAGLREYYISGIYGDECWDAQFAEPNSNYTNQDPDLKPRIKIDPPPYPEFCRHPERCAGLGHCPRDPICAD